MSPRPLLLIALAVFLTACASGPPRGTPGPVITLPGERVPPPPVAPASDAVLGLIAQAREARQGGDLERALALLERAQRLDPARGALYLALAETHAAAGNKAQARAFAERGLLYCQGGECQALARLAR